MAERIRKVEEPIKSDEEPVQQVVPKPEPEPVEDPMDGPRPWRMETFESASGEWRWRMADNLGQVLQESEETWTTKLQALQGSRSVGREQAVVFLDDRQSR